ncbi:hypothetical protein [Nocardia sp. 348MFTsu5.1]|uniref:hypothetical protein n=1 Tax=Nocardia sp. 348MFTsu5.1 TaxID=1172185 RepID=UPI000381424A|nr:hypothetical protein [Nocardia sp. 348MFTsu5.1]
MKKILKSLSEEEYRLVRKTKRKAMADLDEDALIDLHMRTRRARNKHVKNYRQAGAAKVTKKGGRGAARPANSHNAARAEVFEKALAQVSRQLAVVAKKSAADLKDARLSKASGNKMERLEFIVDGKVKGGGKGKVISAGKDRVDATRQSPGRKKYEASSKAAGKRRQAKKDKR